jgi:hypothetical protein
MIKGGKIDGGLVSNPSEDVYKSIQVGAGYEIAGIGLVRAQYVGGTNKITPPGQGTEPTPPTTTYSRLEAAFRLTMVQGLDLDIGAKIPLPVSEDIGSDTYTYQKPFTIAAGANFTLGDLGILGRVDVNVGEYYKSDSIDQVDLASNINVHLVPSYYLAAIDAKLGVELGLEVIGETKVDGKVTQITVPGEDDNGGVNFGFGLWVDKSLGKGNVKTGIGYRIPTKINNAPKDGVLTLPVVITYSF